MPLENLNQKSFQMVQNLKETSITLLEETQSKVEKINAGKLKLDRQKILPVIRR